MGAKVIGKKLLPMKVLRSSAIRPVGLGMTQWLDGKRMMLLCALVCGFLGVLGGLCGGSFSFAVESSSLSTGETAPVGQPAKRSSASVNQGASTAQKSQMMGMVVNLGVGIAMMKIFNSGCHGHDNWGCYAGPLAMMALSQATQNAGASEASGATFKASKMSLSPDDFSLPGGGGVAAADGLGFKRDPAAVAAAGKPGRLSVTDSEIKKYIEELNAKGINLDSKAGTITTTDGKKYPISAFSSPKAMAAAGMSPADVGAAAKALDGINKQLAAQIPSVGGGTGSSMEVDSSGGGTSARGSAYQGSSGDGAPGLADYLAKLKANTTKGASDIAAGKAIRYGDSMIGVESDNIFDMLHRRYQKLRSEGQFIESRE